MSRVPLKSWARLFPELARFDTVDARRLAWKTSARSLRRSTRFWIAALTVGLLGTPLAVILASRLQQVAANWLPFPPAVVRVALGTCIGGLFGLTLVRLFQRSGNNLRMLRQWTFAAGAEPRP